MKRGAAIVALALTLALAGCGSREALRPAEGKALPPKPAMAATQPTPTDLLTPGPQERPDRSEELLRQSEEQRDDRFDLPPQH
ncbi:hypothetical protein SAMN06295912_109108 [Sphingomonas laterariae]|uniref:Argininosuccinate lyase n=1 Tax=Edaphosphingomonas laterariae TaxID=861865 RepID=A0A239FNA6_9SPHN|nr:hypothetical protein [Sphingomonas laterariae]SNS57713.1 hypothetical protein SAMN06295912_109108 [Sphingomonas laterariae]